MQRLLAIDFGKRRIGLALSDPLGLTAQPIPAIPNNTDTMQALESLITDYSITEIIIGLPLNRHGEDSEMTKTVRDFAASLEEQFKKGLKTPPSFRFQDERLSSQAAQRSLIEENMRREKRKEKIDSKAAAFILQGILDSHH